MDAQDITTLAIGYGIFCLGVFAFVMLTFHRRCRGRASMRDMPLWFFAFIALNSVLPLLNVAMLVNTMRLKPE